MRIIVLFPDQKKERDYIVFVISDLPPTFICSQDKSQMYAHPTHLLQWLPLSITLFTILLYTCQADVGTAAQYSPPYLPTACYRDDASQFPSNNLFAAAGDGIWDNGASCGRQYLVRCISATVANTCIPDQTIKIKIVDYALQLVSPPSVSGTTLVLSQTAFGTIANSTAASINIEFQQV